MMRRCWKTSRKETSSLSKGLPIYDPMSMRSMGPRRRRTKSLCFSVILAAGIPCQVCFSQRTSVNLLSRQMAAHDSFASSGPCGRGYRQQRSRRHGVDPTVLSQGAIWNIEAAEASPKAMRRRSREFRDSDTSPGFQGVFASQNSDAKPLTCATCFATSEPRW